MVEMHGHERVVAAQVAERAANRLGQIAVVVALDQVGDDLGVGLRGEFVPLRPQVPPQLGVVLDDPVEDDVDLILTVAMRVGVLLGHPAVGRPARMPKPDLRRRRGDGDGTAAVGSVGLDGLAQVREVPDRSHAVDRAVRDHRNAGRVIAPVLELLQSGNQ
jgi:hypothetical protein